MTTRNVAFIDALITTLVALTLATPVHAAPKSAKDFIDSVAGVYRRHFANALVDGTKYESEDILEVVAFGDDAAYVRMELQFANGHLGGIYGIATFDSLSGNTLVYDAPGSADDNRCIVRYVFSESVTTQATYDKQQCSSYHGARGSLDGAEWPAKAKRKIKYTDKILKSRQYKEAVTEFEEKRKEKPNGPSAPAKP